MYEVDKLSVMSLFPIIIWCFSSKNLKCWFADDIDALFKYDAYTQMLSCLESENDSLPIESNNEFSGKLIDLILMLSLSEPSVILILLYSCDWYEIERGITIFPCAFGELIASAVKSFPFNR